ncbi:hypothetical protein C8Q75DRAFT_802564 [Abortiporus biennis]|nr:hypothetical protein C8Q75DRAFT_802564 [Abortiporus biennis]
MIEIEWEPASHNYQRRGRGPYIPYRHKASTIHGWVTKLRGTLLGDEAVRRRGIREMRDARTTRKYKKLRTAEMRRRGERNGGFFSFFTSKKVLKKSKSTRSRRAIVDKVQYSTPKRGKEPFMHFPKRTRPPYHGHGTIVLGIVTQDKSKVARGKSMNRSAMRERAKERQRREKQKHREAIEMKREARGIRR